MKINKLKMRIRSSDTDEKFNIGTYIPYTLIILVVLSVLSGLAYGWKIALNVFLYGIACGLIAFVGFIPIAGPVIYWLAISVFINPLVSLPPLIQLMVFILGLINAAFYTTISIIVVWLLFFD